MYNSLLKTFKHDPESGLLVESKFKAISWGSYHPPSMFKYNSSTHSYDDSRSLLNNSQKSVLKVKQNLNMTAGKI
jgi:hypothetical protein